MQEFTLSNGLRVILEEHHTCDSVSVQCWVGVGSICEAANEHGISHLIEHMMFKGSRNFGVGEIANTIEASGGNVNAYTTFDHTVYYLNVASSYLSTGLKVFSDALFHSLIDETELTREKEVVVEEIHRSTDNPSSEVTRRIFSHIYHGTEVARPIIGTEESVRSFSRQLVFDYYKNWYHPKNMVLVIAGNFSTPETLPLIESIFGESVPLPSRLGELVYGPLQKAEHRPPLGVALKADQQICRINISFAIPGKEAPENAALSMGAFILGGSDGARLQRQIRDKLGLAAVVHSSVYSPSFQGIFTISAVTSFEKINETIKALGSCTADFIQNNLATKKEMDRAQGCIKADEVFGRETPGGLASKICGSLTTAEGAGFYQTYLNRLLSVTPDDIRKVMTEWLQPDHASIVCQSPNGTSLDESEFLPSFRQGFESTANTKPMSEEPLIKLPATKFQKAVKSERKIIKINDAVTFVYTQEPETEIFNLCAAAAGGLRAETLTNNGVYHAIGQLLGLASSQYDYSKMLDITEGHGAEISGFSGRDSFGMQLSCLAEDSQALLKIFCDAWWEPRFPKEQFATFQRETLEQIKSTDDSPSGKLMQVFQKNLYGDHPYGNPIFGSASLVKHLDCDALDSFYDKSKRSRPWYVAAVGPYDADQVCEELQKLVGGWKIEPQNLTLQLPGPAEMVLTDNLRLKEYKDREQTHICVGTIGLSWSDTRRYAMDVAEAILGGQGGRLFMELRDKRSMAYTVAPFIHHSAHRGLAGTYIATSTDKAERAIDELKKEIKKLAHTPPPDDELQRAKRYLNGTHALELERTSAQARTMALMELYGEGHDDFEKYAGRIEKVTASEVSEVVHELFENQSILEVLVGKS